MSFVAVGSTKCDLLSTIFLLGTSSCTPSPCGAHGTCISAVLPTGTLAVCNCEDRWTGKFCDVNMNGKKNLLLKASHEQRFVLQRAVSLDIVRMVVFVNCSEQPLCVVVQPHTLAHDVKRSLSIRAPLLRRPFLQPRRHPHNRVKSSGISLPVQATLFLDCPSQLCGQTMCERSDLLQQRQQLLLRLYIAMDGYKM